VGCSVASAFAPIPTATGTPAFTATPAPTQTPLPTATATATQVPFFLDATVWSGDLQVPVLLYHRFVPDSTKESTTTKTRLEDFKNQIQLLYDAGYSLVPLQSWLDGTFIVPAGRRPLVLTLDDGWFADQLYINDDGSPNVNSGLGVLWYFSQEHPDFGFSAAIFTNMCDKFYGDRLVGDRFLLGEGDAWKDKLGQTIAWAMTHSIEPYNHTCNHIRLDLTKNADIIYQLRQNDYVTRTLLERVGRGDLISQLGNIIALPFGIWPATQSGIEVIQNYKNPEGLQTRAIMEAYNLYEAVLTPSVFSTDFNRFNIPRLTAGKEMINLVVEKKDQVPAAVQCSLGPMNEADRDNLQVISTMIGQAISTKSCPGGIYYVNGNVFDARQAKVTLFHSQSQQTSVPLPTATSTPGQ